MTKLTGI